MRARAAALSVAGAMAVLALSAPLAGAAEKSGPWLSPGAVAASPDGKSVYAVGQVHTVTLARDASTGTLTQVDARAPGGDAIAMTPDGRWLFVGYGGSTGSPGGIHVLARDPSTGLLTHTQTVSGSLSPGSPTFGAITDLVASPDGRQLYVAQRHDDAVIVLQIDPSTGGLSMSQAEFSGRGGVESLGQPVDLAMSPDGRSLYVAGGQVTGFQRDPLSGRLTPSGSWPAARTSAFDVAVAPDGRRVYAGLMDFTAFSRDESSGALSAIGSTNLAPDCQPSCFDGGPLTVSPDSASVFSSEVLDNRLLQATATPDGATLAHDYRNGAGGLTRFTDVSGQDWSPDGRQLYVATAERHSRDTIGGFGAGTLHTFAWDGSRLNETQTVDPTSLLFEQDAARPPGLSIDAGAIYTNDPDVRLDMVLPPSLPSSFLISNEPDMAASVLRRADDSGRYPWRLDTTGPPDRSVRHVYVRFISERQDDQPLSFSDDIILDRIAPQLVSARLRRGAARSKLLLRARDNRSGVRRLQLAARRSHPRRAQRFTRNVSVRHAPRRLWVRVIDGAGNHSRWRRAKG